jgi:hypothetical protein
MVPSAFPMHSTDPVLEHPEKLFGEAGINTDGIVRSSAAWRGAGPKIVAR